jgi:hypothetical protein
MDKTGMERLSALSRVVLAYSASARTEAQVAGILAGEGHYNLAIGLLQEADKRRQESEAVWFDVWDFGGTLPIGQMPQVMREAKSFVSDTGDTCSAVGKMINSLMHGITP